MAILVAVCAAVSPVFAEMEAAAEKTDPVLVYRQAGASQQQESLIRQLAAEYEKAARVRVERIRNLSKQLTELSYNAELDDKQILALQEEMNELHARVNTDRVKLMLQIRALLSAEQKEKLVEILKEKRGAESANAVPSPEKTTEPSKL